LQFTHSIFLVGLTVAAQLLPSIIIGPIAGVYIDRYNRKDIMLLSNLLQGVLVASIALLVSFGALNLPLLLVLVFLLNAGAQFVRPAVTAVIPRMVENNNLAAANSLFSIGSSANQVAGYGLGGLFIAMFGVLPPIYYDALSFFLAFLLVALVRRSYGEIPKDNASKDASASFKIQLVEGWRFVSGSRFLLELMVLGALVNFFFAGLTALLAPYAEITVHGNSATYGFISAAIALGMILGSLLVGKVNSRAYVGKLLFLGLVASGLFIAAMGLVSSSLPATILSFIVGITLAAVTLPLQVLVQVKVPGKLLGRVGTVMGALLTLTQPISAALSGGVATTISVGETFLLYGLLIVFATVGMFFVFKELRMANY
jgi:MFS family permease